MRRWFLYLAVALAAALGVGWLVHSASEERAQRRREIEYQNKLHSYSENLKAGTSRREVENSLSAKGISFRLMCCVARKEYSRGVYDYTYDELVKIGQEDVPWACSENNVYITFQFMGAGPNKNSVPAAEPSDTLKNVSVFHWLEGCM